MFHIDIACEDPVMRAAGEALVQQALQIGLAYGRASGKELAMTITAESDSLGVDCYELVDDPDAESGGLERQNWRGN